MERKKFKIDLTVAVEAFNKEEAIEILSNPKTLEGIQQAIIDSQDQIVEMFSKSLEEKDNSLIN